MGWRVLVIFLAGLASAAGAETTVRGDLERRADLGFRAEEDGAALKVTRLDTGSPAARTGLREGDRIAEVDGQAFVRPYEGVALLQTLRGGRPVWLGLEREGRLVEARFVPSPLAPEEDPGLDIEYDVLVASDGSRLRTILSRPAGARGRLPVLYFTQWVSCGSLEGPAAAQLRALAAGAGMALMRVERAGAGDSLGPACHQLDFDTEVRHYREALDGLLRHPWIDPRRVVIYGSSLGAITAPLVAQDHNVAGLIVQGGGALTYVERMIGFDRLFIERSGVAPAEIDRRMRDAIAFHAEYLLARKSPEQIARERPDLARVWGAMRGTGDGVHYGRPYAWHQQAAAKNLLAAWAAIEAPVLVVYGEYDQFETRHGHALIAETLNRLRPGSATFVEIPRADHDLEIYPSAEDAYAYRDGRAEPDLFLAPAIEWLRRNVAPAPAAAAPASTSVALASYSRARAVLDAAIAATGGETALRGLGLVTRRGRFNYVDMWQQPRPFAGDSDSDDMPVAVRSSIVTIVDHGGSRFVQTERFEDGPGDLFVRRVAGDATGGFEAGRFREAPSFLGLYSAGEFADLRARERRQFPEALLLEALDRAETLQWVEAGRTAFDTISFVDSAGQSLLLRFDAATRLLDRTETLRDHPVLGDTFAETRFGDYRPVGALRLPFHHFTRVGGHRSRDYRLAAIELGGTWDESLFQPPEQPVEIRESPSAPTLNALGGGVYEILGPYNLMFAVFRDFVLMAEAPRDLAYAEACFGLIRSVAPGKRIRVVATHFHGDHVAGIPFFVAQGSPIWATVDARGAIETALASRRTFHPPRTVLEPRPLALHVVSGQAVLDDGTQRVEIYDVGPTPHAAHMLVVHFPRVRTILVADLWDILSPDLALGGRDAEVLMHRLRGLGVAFDLMVPVHGVPATRAQLERGLALRARYVAPLDVDAWTRAQASSQ